MGVKRAASPEEIKMSQTNEIPISIKKEEEEVRNCCRHENSSSGSGCGGCDGNWD